MFTHSLMTGQGMTAGKRDPPAMLLLTAFHLPRLLSSYSTLAFRPFPPPAASGLLPVTLL